MNQEQSKNTINTKMAQALFYLEKLGWSVIPVGADKKPLVEWKLYQTQRATTEDITNWFSQPEVNIGVVTGKISNLIVVDIDPRHGGSDEAFNEVLSVKSATGGGGVHYFFQFEDGIQNSASIRPGIDIRGEGGYVVAPPSSHSSGKDYEWVNSPENTSVAPLPEFVKDWIKESRGFIKAPGPKLDEKLLNGVAEGNRNDSAAAVVGKLLKRFEPEEWESDVWPLFQGWNLKNTPPLPETELRSVFESISGAELVNGNNVAGQRTAADKLVDLTLAGGAELYLDQTGEPHITFPEKPVVGFPVKSSTFKHWLAGKYWEKNAKGFSGEQFQQAVSSLGGKAYFEGKSLTLFNRVARKDNVIFYDLGTDSKVVRISPQGWQLTNNCPFRFRRFRHQKPQVEPLSGGKLENVTKYLNLKTETDRLLFLTYLITVFIPDIPRVVLINIGDQGSAKSTALRVARSLIDPSASELLSPPSDITELAQASNHHYCLYLDNLSYLKGEVSDALCRLATGIGFTKRKLFTDDEDILFNQRVAIGITGINLVAQKADLLDRCLILSFERIPEAKRTDEEQFWKSFNMDKPYLLGAAFDLLSKVLGTIDEIKLAKKPRMADYAKYAVAGALALGKTAEEFLLAFGENINRQNQAAIEASPTAQAILQFMSEEKEWSGSSSELYEKLKPIVEKERFQLGGSDGFPKSSNWLWKRIMTIRPNLSALGVEVSKYETDNNSIINLKRNTLQDGQNTAITASDTGPNGAMAAVAANEPQLEESESKNQLNSIPGLEDYQ